jgi:hypothetical protein
LALAALTLLVAACTEEGPLGGTPTQVAGQAPGTLAQNQPATPPPQAIASPKHTSPNQVATPTPLNLASPPPPSPSPVPLPGASTTATAAPGVSPSPTASGSPDPAASPTPTPSPSPFTTTGVATDLAVSGPAYFVLSTKKSPTALEDLVFTRHGHFKMVTEGANHYLKHADHAYYVLGHMKISGADDAPDETNGISEAVLTTTWSGSPSSLGAVAIDVSSDSSKVKFTIRGELLINGVNPGGRHTYVGLAQFQQPENLIALPAFARFYRYPAGTLFLGVPFSGTSRPVGTANPIKTETLNGD